MDFVWLTWVYQGVWIRTSALNRSFCGSWRPKYELLKLHFRIHPRKRLRVSEGIKGVLDFPHNADHQRLPSSLPPNHEITALIFAGLAANGAVVKFTYDRGCTQVGEIFKGECNFCADPAGDWSGVQFSEISDDTHYTLHNGHGCTRASEYGRGYGPACWQAGSTKIRSAWVACPGQKRLANGTIVNVQH